MTLLRCGCGSQLATLSTRRAATVRDFVPLVNIGSFGRCRAPENPSRRDGESTAPCVPSVSRPWAPGGVALLSSESTTRCRWGGVIEIVATERSRG